MASSQHYLLCFHSLKHLLAAHDSSLASSTAPLLQEKRQQILSRCQYLPGSSSFLRLHRSTRQDCGRLTRAPEHGHGHLDCWEQAGWGDLFQSSTMTFPARGRSNYFTPLSVWAIEKCSRKGQTHKVF